MSDRGKRGGIDFYQSFASSAARSGGRLALSESFLVYGDGVTPDQIRYVINYQLIRGINAFNFMSLPYGRKRGLALCVRPALCVPSETVVSRRQKAAYESFVALGKELEKLGIDFDLIDAGGIRAMKQNRKIPRFRLMLAERGEYFISDTETQVIRLVFSRGQRAESRTAP